EFTPDSLEVDEVCRQLELPLRGEEREHLSGSQVPGFFLPRLGVEISAGEFGEGRGLEVLALHDDLQEILVNAIERLNLEAEFELLRGCDHVLDVFRDVIQEVNPVGTGVSQLRNRGRSETKDGGVLLDVVVETRGANVIHEVHEGLRVMEFPAGLRENVLLDWDIELGLVEWDFREGLPAPCRLRPTRVLAAMATAIDFAITRHFEDAGHALTLFRLQEFEQVGVIILEEGHRQITGVAEGVHYLIEFL